MKDIKDITKSLEDGVKAMMESDKFIEYLQFLGKFHNYSFNNTYLILRQCPNASLVAGYQTWKKKFDRQVKKGSKAIWILAPMMRTATKKGKDENGDETEEQVSWMSYRAVSVFDVSQTEGKDLPKGDFCKALTGDAEGFKITFDKLVKFVNIPVEYENITDGSNGYFDREKNRIAIKTGMSEQQTLKTLSHEIAHAKLHGKGCSEEKADKKTKELQAEAVAYTVCNSLGIDSSEYSFGYIAGWSKDKDIKELQRNMQVITSTANSIINAIA